jgi:hypothetical protein
LLACLLTSVLACFGCHFFPSKTQKHNSTNNTSKTTRKTTPCSNQYPSFPLCLLDLSSLWLMLIRE